MSDNKVQVEFGGKVDSSFDSSSEHLRKSLVETTKTYAEFAAHITENAATAVAAHAAIHGGQQLLEAGNSRLSASFAVLRFGAAQALKGVLPSVAGAISGFSLVYGSVKILSGALSLLERASGTAATGLGKFSLLEDLAGKLRRVSSSAEAARQKVGEVAATFRGTPIAVPEAVDAYRSARVADGGSGELSSPKGLRLLGDVATSSGNGIAEVSGAVSGLYSALQSGHPIEQTADKLRDMGVISADTRHLLDTLLASGKSGPEVWTAFRTSLESSTGAMKEQQQTLSGLQKAVQAAKDQLYESFGEGSGGFEKDKLSAQLAILQKIEPAAREAGNVYGGFKSVIADNVRVFLEFIGVKAASDKALGNSSALKAAVDSYVVLRVALAAFAAVALVVVPLYAGLAISAGTFSLAVIGAAAAFAGLAAAGVAGVAGLGIYVLHLKQVTEARLAYVNGTSDLINGLQREQNAMVSAADRAKVLANAYAIAKKAREDYNNAKDKGGKSDAKGRLDAAESEIGKVESNANTLVNLRSRVRQQIAEAKTQEDRGPLVIQEAQLSDRINRGERATAADFPLDGPAGEAEAKQAASRNNPQIEEAAAKGIGRK